MNALDPDKDIIKNTKKPHNQSDISASQSLCRYLPAPGCTAASPAKGTSGRSSERGEDTLQDWNSLSSINCFHRRRLSFTWISNVFTSCE